MSGDVLVGEDLEAFTSVVTQQFPQTELSVLVTLAMRVGNVRMAVAQAAVDQVRLESPMFHKKLDTERFLKLLEAGACGATEAEQRAAFGLRAKPTAVPNVQTSQTMQMIAEARAERERLAAYRQKVEGFIASIDAIELDRLKRDALSKMDPGVASLQEGIGWERSRLWRAEVYELGQRRVAVA